MDRYDVVLQAIDAAVDRDEAAHAASVVLELDLHELRRALSSLPAKVLEDVDERSAEALLGPLQRAGWRVRLVRRPPARRMSLSPRPFEVGDPSRRPSPYPPPRATPYPPMQPADPRRGASHAPGPIEPPRATPYPPMQPAQPRSITPYPPPSTPPASASLAPPRPASAWPPPPGESGHGELDAGSEHALLPLPELELDLPPAPSRSTPAQPLAPALPISEPPPRAIAPRALAASHSAASHSAAPPAPPEESAPEGETLVEFFASLPRTLLVPVRGDAVKWLLRSLVLAIGMGLLSLGGVGIALMRSYIAFGGLLVFGLAATSFWIGHLFAYFRACLWAVIGGDEGPDAPPSFDGDDIYARLFDGAVVVIAFVFVNLAVAFSGAAVALDELGGGGGGRFLIANLLLGLHMPIGLALMAVRQSRGSYFDLITAVKLIVTAPIHLLVVLTLSFALSRVSTLVLEAIGSALAASALAGHESVLWVGVPLAALAVLALTLVQWGLLGAVMGAVCRARPGLVA